MARAVPYAWLQLSHDRLKLVAAVGEPGGPGDIHALSSQLVDAAADHLVHDVGFQALTHGVFQIRCLFNTDSKATT